MPSPRHVLIIGGGLSGPGLALSLARHNIRSTIFEIRSVRGDSGGSISLGPNGLRVLDKYAGVHSALKRIGYSYNAIGTYTAEGERLGEIRAGEQDDQGNGYPGLRIMRPELHKTLLDMCDEKGIEIKYGMKLSKIVEGDDGVAAHFEDGSNYKGDILIGSDGIHSKVRDHVLGPDRAVKSKYCGIYVVSNQIPASNVEKPADFTLPAFVFTPSGFLMCVPIDVEGKTIAFGINKTSEKERTREEWAEFEASGEAARLAKLDYSGVQTQPVRSIMDNSKDKEAKLWAPYEIPDIATWHTSRVCLIGDSAHGMAPNGLGSGLAFEDAGLLTRMLTTLSPSSSADYDSLFSRFEALRRPRITPIRTQGPANAFRAQTGPWLWYLKRLAFKAFFWWKGGQLSHVTAYDVDTVNLEA